MKNLKTFAALVALVGYLIGAPSASAGSLSDDVQSLYDDQLKGMGETSAKSMRGSGMEDVIFSGTSNKPSKNIAEVSIALSNENKDGPIQYNDLDEIEIRRKIEKDKGSKFYINNKEVRAKDAQMFFADLSTGAHSPSLISQGRIGALVTAKPADRRAILEEAAGIAGLHVRRHEAELRLSAAENNLKRADELRRQQERQLANLQKQAEEAAKYKSVSEEIKKVEATVSQSCRVGPGRPLYLPEFWH